MLILAFVVVAAVPIAILAMWESRISYQREVDSVQERHLLIARNLTATMSRYVRDVEAALNLALASDAMAARQPALVRLLEGLGFRHICVLGPDDRLEHSLKGLDSGSQPPAAPKILVELRALAASAADRVRFSPLRRDAANEPVLYLVKALPDGRLGLGIVGTSYLVSLQQAIAFGEHGHAVVVDSQGQVIAHPLKERMAAAHNLSDLPVVAAMMRGESGVGTFHSTVFKGEMIAGYSVVPETGWGVMVPQPAAELRRRASEVASVAAAVAGLAFVSVICMGWLFALQLMKPIRAVADVAEAVLLGNEEVAVPPFQGLVPREVRRMGEAFNTMLQAIRRKAAETQQALRHAETSSQAKTQFLANMSHEIRTPLNEVVGMIELMQLTELTPAQRRHLETATRSSRTLLRIVDDILDLSKIEAGKLELDLAPFHLPTLIHDVRMLLADQALARGLTLSAIIPDSLNLMVVGDAHRLLQILSNLVGNAVKFTPSGSVTIRASLEQERGQDLLLRFEVSDTGIGIPADKQSAIFDAFTQSDSSMTRRYGGTGLGLSIARQLVHMMDGDIGVRSEVGAGSTFWFSAWFQHSAAPLPQARNPAPFRAPVSSDPAPVGTPAGRAFQSALRQLGRASVSILVVEDNPANMRVTQALLETLGCGVAGAANGLEAVAAYRTRTFDLVLMDCQMPEMDGYEATQAIRQLETFQGRHTPIIALTAHAMPGSRESSLAAGMDDQLTKPLTLSALTEKLLRWLAPLSAATDRP